MASNVRIETIVNVKIRFEGQTHKFKIPLHELVPSNLPDKLCHLLEIPPDSKVVFERYSDSTRAFVVLDHNNVSSYKQLYRAARAKLRLRLQGTIIDQEKNDISNTMITEGNEKALPVVSSIPDTPIQTLSKPKIKTLSTDKCRHKSSVTDSLTDIQQSLQKLHLNDNVNNITTIEEVVPAPNNKKPKHLTGATKHDLTMKGKCPYMAKYRDNSQINNSNAQCKAELLALAESTLDHHVRGHFDVKKSSSCSEDLYTLTVICNNCNSLISGEHYHCSTCEGGDYDLCQKCVSNGNFCYVEDHWLIKRFMKDGEPVNSITQTILSRNHTLPRQTKEPCQKIEAIFATRTCNCCIQELTEEHFVTCTICPDYDLCMSCHVALGHGHHPKHAFEPVIKDITLDENARVLLAPGRNFQHDVTCGVCAKDIYGVRHKCLDCPHSDYCSSCVSNAKNYHYHHRFVQLYEKLEDDIGLGSFYNTVQHHGVFCDGPLCKNTSSYIRGDRYKCAICDDTDFCSQCEAHAANTHDSNHPLIKLRYPLQKFVVKTQRHTIYEEMSTNSDKNSESCQLSNEDSPAISTNAATQVQTIFDLHPSENCKASQEDNSLNSKQLGLQEPAIAEPESQPDLIVHFIRDDVIDGTFMSPNEIFKQTWYLRNAGRYSWPSGCYVKFVSGTDMFHSENKTLEGTHDPTSTVCSSVYDSEVIPGETIGFTVTLKAPGNSGKYVSFWRLATSDGLVVGPKLWCEIRVNSVSSVSTETTVEKIEEMFYPKLKVERNINNAAIANEKDFEEVSEKDLDDEDIVEFSTTDDEYDFLDASDEEYAIEQQKKE